MKRFISMIISLVLILPPAKAAAADYIKWVDFDVTSEALRDSADIDISSSGEKSWVTLLSILACRYGGDFSKYEKSDLTDISENYAENIAKYEDSKSFRYYEEAYHAVLDGMLASFTQYTETDGILNEEKKYGICAYSPIAKGYYYNHCDDFGVSRSYGYRRKHLGHDMMGSVGTPIIAIEGGYVECLGWNQYGGWRIGIRSFDNKRYYYYAHLRRDHPFADMYEGKIVSAGEVIGYMGMTGYSKTENTNNIKTPHLHVGMELIFDKSQKDGYCQIWINMMEITEFLASYRSPTVFSEESNERRTLQYSVKEDTPD